jgi:hypothetical protein
MKKIYIPFLLSFFIQYAQTGADIDGDGILDQEFYRVKAGEPFNPDLEPKVLNGLMIYEIKGLLLNDSDNDGVLDKDDNCPSNPNENQLDSDSDGVGDVCDNCITRSNSNQKDENSNGVGDVCDPELDTDNDGFDGKRHSLGDGVNNANDNCVNIYNKWQRDHDEDGIGDVCDDDVIILWFNYHDDIGKSIDLSEIIDANYSGLKIKDGNSTDFFEIIESEIILKKSLKDENLELLQAKPNTSERGFKPFKIDIEFSQNNNVISKTLIIYINNVLPPKKVVKAKPVDHPSTNIFFERFDLWNPNFNYDGNGYDSTMYPEEYHNNHLDTIIGIDHDRWMDVGFEYLTVPVDLNDDNLKDLLIGDERINVDGYDLTIHQLRDPVYLKNLGNFEFEIYHNSNNNKLVLESPQMLKLTDLDDDNKDELIYFGEHYHAFLWNYGSNLIIKYLENNNLKYGIDFNKDEFKKFSYLSVKNNELVDMRDKIDYSDCPDCLFSIYSHTTGDIDNDGDVDILFGAQTHSTQTNYGEGGGRNLIIARNDGSGNLKLEFLGNGDFETSESDMVLFDINDDNFKDLVFTGNKGLQFMLNNGSGNIEYNYDNVVENWELFELGSRNFKVLDIENDGIEELIVYCSGSFGALSEEGPYNKIEIYVPKENSLERVTDLYFSNNENYMGYYSHSGSFIQYIDLDNDGITDLVPKFDNDVEGGRFFKGDWNNSKGFQYFKFDTSTNKYKVVDLGVIGTGYDARINKEEENSLYNNFEFIDLDNDGLLEFIYLTKSHFQIYKFKDLDSDGTPDIFDNDVDGDGVTDDLDQCSDTPTGETSDENGCSDSQKDTDNDGVTDDIDQCPDTPSGAVVDVNGCEVFTLPVQNFKVEVGSATCVGNSDGIINLSIEDASYDYSVTITGRDDVTIAGDSKTASITGLPKGTYTVCFKVDGEDNFEQCFEVEVNEPQALSAFMEVNGQNLNITMSGSSQYSIDVNGNTQITSSNNFETVLSSGLNIIKVYTSLKCQGFVEEQILISEEVYYYPNPTQNDVNILVGGKDENVSVSVLTIDGSLIYSGEQHVSNITRKTVVDLSKQTSGTYIVVIESETVSQTFKIIKE